MKKYYILGLILSAVIFQNCKKEDKILKSLVGTWTIKEYKRANNYYKTDFSTSITTLEFIAHKKAYTSTLKGIFRIDYTDPLRTDLVDTFLYQLKNNEMDITSVQNRRINNVFPNITPTLLKRRFKIKEYKKNSLYLTRVDSTDLYIKATK